MALAAVLVLSTGCTSTAGDDQTSGGSSTAASSGSSPAGASGRAREDATSAAHWLVTLGDSYISGQGARWAGNTSGGPRAVDALGVRAYDDNGRHESEPGCHRAATSVAALGRGPLRGKNLACSGATVSSRWDGSVFEPGLDWYDDGDGHVSQLVALRDFAEEHDVTDVVVSIGGNDFGFGSVLGSCVTDFISTVGANPSYCKDDRAVAAKFASRSAAEVSGRIRAALGRVGEAMSQAGEAQAEYSVVVLTYPSPVPPGHRLRYHENLLHRFFVGGCPIFDADATWANRVVLSTINRAVSRAVDRSGLANVSRLDLTSAFGRHRLCEKGVHQLEETRLASWRSPGARQQLEWTNMLYTKSLPWELEESLHPNYWGVLAERRCVRSAVTGRPSVAEVCRNGRLRFD